MIFPNFNSIPEEEDILASPKSYFTNTQRYYHDFDYAREQVNFLLNEPEKFIRHMLTRWCDQCEATKLIKKEEFNSSSHWLIDDPDSKDVIKVVDQDFSRYYLSDLVEFDEEQYSYIIDNYESINSFERLIDVLKGANPYYLLELYSYSHRSYDFARCHPRELDYEKDSETIRQQLRVFLSQ